MGGWVGGWINVVVVVVVVVAAAAAAAAHSFTGLKNCSEGTTGKRIHVV